jgi:predicted nucleic acid-binding protein
MSATTTCNCQASHKSVILRLRDAVQRGTICANQMVNATVIVVHHQRGLKP